MLRLVFRDRVCSIGCHQFLLRVYIRSDSQLLPPPRLGSIFVKLTAECCLLRGLTPEDTISTNIYLCYLYIYIWKCSAPSGNFCHYFCYFSNLCLLTFLTFSATFFSLKVNGAVFNILYLVLNSVSFCFNLADF